MTEERVYYLIFERGVRPVYTEGDIVHFGITTCGCTFLTPDGKGFMVHPSQVDKIIQCSEGMYHMVKSRTIKGVISYDTYETLCEEE